MTQSSSALSRYAPAALLLMAAVAAFATVALNALDNGRLTAGESSHLIKSVWYASGAVRPYSAADGGAIMPGYPLLVGTWQAFTGADPATARWLSIALTTLSSTLLFVLCRRLTANTLIAAAGVFMFLVTPAAAYLHATATPIAATTTLHLAALILVVQGMGRPRVWISVLFSMCLVGLILLDRVALAAVVFLAPLYILAIGRNRALHAAVLLVVIAAGVGGAYAIFGARWLDALRWGPLLAPIWTLATLAPASLSLVDANTVQGSGVALAVPRGFATTVVDSLILPYGAGIAAALALFVAAGRGLRVLWAVPIYLLWLLGARLISAVACDTCLIEYAASDLAVASLGGALTFAMVWRAVRDGGLTGSVIVIGGAIAVAAANTFAPALASRPDRQFFPAPMLRYPGSGGECAEMRALEQFLAKNAPAGEQLLIFHDLPSVPLAATLAGRRIPPQSLRPLSTYRQITSVLSGNSRESTLAAIEGAGLWSDETLTRWLDREVDVVLLEDGLRVPGRDRIDPALEAGFDRIGEISVAGRRLVLWRRRA